jgi:hypothetical protein
MQPKDWLKYFLFHKQQDGRALYRYRMSDDEFASLQDMLEISAAFGVEGISKFSGWNATFVIYAAEWWRRNYDGGEWSWEKIFVSFDADANGISAAQRKLIVELGLNYWQRPVRVINGRARYIGTIATEGGLPVKLLHSANNALSEVFKHAIPRYLRLPNADIIDAIHIIADNAHHLPQNDAIYAILADMLCLVAALKTDYQLADKDKPVEYLNQTVPDWQAQFPLPISDPIALELLSEMINTAVQMESTAAYELRGNKLTFTSTPKSVYLGTPELFDSQHNQKVALLAKPVNSKTAWQALKADQQGVYELRYQDAQANVKFCEECALLPEHFSLRFIPASGCIEIEQSGNAYISCESPFLTGINVTETGRSIEFNAHDTPPPNEVNLILRWAGKSERLILTVPFPVRGGQLLDADGNKLSQLSINALNGVRLRVLSAGNIALEFTLQDDNQTSNDIYIRDEFSHTDVVLELALSDYQQGLQDLLASSHNPDSFVRLSVYEQGAELLRADIIRVLQSPTPQTQNRQVHSINEINNLSDAQTISDDALRQLFIRHHLKQLTLNFAADDWSKLRDLQTDAPLINNELWTAATQDNRVLAALALQLDSQFIQRFTVELLVCWELISLKDWLVIFTRYKNYLAQEMDDADIKNILGKRIDKLNALSPALSIITQLLKQQLCDLEDEELLFMQSEDALPLIAEQLEQEQQQLKQRQANRAWTDFLRIQLTAHWQTIPAQTQQLLNLDEAKEHHAVSLLPLLVAHFSLTHVPPQSASELFKIRQLKAFDEHWFTTAFTLALAYLSQQTDYTQLLQQDIATMINSDENDLLAEIEQQIALAHQEAQGLETDIHDFKGNQAELDALRAENVELISTIEQLGEIIQKRDDALKLLLEEVKNLNAKIREIRSELQAKANA